MITLNYAKKVGDAYVLNFFADSEEDIEKFDITKEFMFYGVPSAGSLITCVSKDSSTNYYVDKSGSLVKIDQGDPSELIEFFVGQTISGVVVDPNALTKQQMDEILKDFEGDINLVTGNGGGDGIGAILAQRHQGANLLLVCVADEDYVRDDNIMYVVYTTKDINIEGANLIHGWNELQFTRGEEFVATELTNKKQYDFADGATTTINEINVLFDNFNAIVVGAVEGEPEPSALTPFSVGQTITGYDFGNVQNGDTSDAMDAFLAGLTYDDGTAILALFSEGPLIMAAELSYFGGTSGGYALFPLTSPNDMAFVYSTHQDTITGEMGSQTLSKGYQNLTDGKISIDASISPLSVTSVSDIEGWNGILVGAIEGEPSSLTPFSVGQTITGVDFGNVQNGDTNAAMDAFLGKLTYSEGMSPIFEYGDGRAIAAVDLSIFELGVTGYAIVAPVDEVLYSTAAFDDGDGWVVMKGYNGLTDGKYELPETPASVTSISDAQGWNGVLIGAVESGTVTSYEITPSVTNGSASGDNSIDEKGTATVTISADAGYILPQSVTVSGASYTYNDTTGEISLSNPTADVTITVVCETQFMPFAANETFSQISVDPSVMTPDELAAWLNALADGNLAEYTYENAVGDKQTRYFTVETFASTVKMASFGPRFMDGVERIEIFGDDMTSPVQIPKGLIAYTDQGGTPTFTSITSKTTYTIDSSDFNNCTISSVSADLDAINGTVIGIPR